MLSFAQLAAGAINLALLAPIGMQIVHLLLADLLWISLVLLSAESMVSPHPIIPGVSGREIV